MVEKRCRSGWEVGSFVVVVVFVDDNDVVVVVIIVGQSLSLL